jgi:hypothetical protein
MTKAADLQKRLLDELASHVGAHGFEAKPVGQSFRRKTPSGRVSLHAAFVPHGGDVAVTADVAVRLDALEDLVNETNAQLPKSEKQNTSSLGAELGNLSEGRQKRWTLVEPSDAATAAQSILALYELVGAPSLERLSDPENAFVVLSSNERDDWLWSPIHGARCQRAVGLAFLLGKRAELPALIEREEAFLKAKNDFGLKAFQQFVAHLRQKL